MTQPTPTHPTAKCHRFPYTLHFGALNWLKYKTIFSKRGGIKMSFRVLEIL